MAFNDSHLKNKNEYWESLQQNLREVSKWPKWMRGEAEIAATSQEEDSERQEETVADDPEAAA